MKAHIQAIRIFLLVLIVLGFGLLTTQAYWVPTVVQILISHEQAPLVVPVSTTTPKAHASPSKPHTVPPAITSGVDVTALIGPTCPVQTADGKCDDKPYEATLVFKNMLTGLDDAIAKTDAAGHLSLALKPGTYTLRAQSTAILPRLSPVTFSVGTTSRTALTLNFDSGIR